MTGEAGAATLGLMAVQPTRLLTYKDFLTFPLDGIRREIVEGEVLVTPAPSIRHQDLVLRLCYALEEHIRGHGGGRVFVSPLDVRLSEHDVVEPDVIFVAEDALSVIRDKFILGAPSLLVEVVSDPRTDRVRKRGTYARAGVSEYWIVDPDADRVEVYHLRSGRYRKPEILEPGEALTTSLLPGLRIDVAELLAR